MKDTLKPVTALLISVAILLTGQGLQGTLLPIRATLETFSTISVGIMGAAYFLGFTIGCLLGAELVKRVGHIRVFLAMTAIASTTALIHALILLPCWNLEKECFSAQMLPVSCLFTGKLSLLSLFHQDRSE